MIVYSYHSTLYRVSHDRMPMAEGYIFGPNSYRKVRKSIDYEDTDMFRIKFFDAFIV